MGQTSRLTDTEIRNYKLPEGQKEFDLPDGGNLVLRVKTNGKATTKAWRFPFTLKGERDFVYIGEYPAISLAEARERAGRYREQLKRKENPKAILEAAAAVAHAKALATEHGEAPETLGELFARWHKDYLSAQHTDAGAYMKGIFDRHVLAGGMADLRLEHMRAAHVKTILQNAQNKGLTGTTGRILDSLRQMIHWAASFEWMDRDPTLGIKKKTFGGLTQEGERALSEDEVTQLHWRMKKSHLTNRWKHCCWLISATGTRVEETMLAERADVNLSKRTWTIPVENQKKTNRATKPTRHVIHLSPFAIKQMEALLAMPGTERFIFPAVARGRDLDAPANEKTLTHALGNLQGAEHKGRRSTTELLLEDGAWSPHDLRRTSSSLMRELGVDSDVVDRCQNHVEPDRIKRIYQRAELRTLMIAAWDTLGSKLEELTSLPDPEPEYVAPTPRYKVVDATDPAAVAKRDQERAAELTRREARKARTGRPPAMPPQVDYADEDQI